jgi:hypothetical protein
LESSKGPPLIQIHAEKGTMMGNANEALFGSGSGAPSFSWGRHGSPPERVAAGLIVEMDATQQRDTKGELKFWPSGDKMMVALVTLATDERDPAIDDDDGHRTLWVSGRNMTNAVRDAVKAARARELEIGGYLEVVHTGYGKAEKGAAEPRTFEATYRKPTTNAAASAALNGPQEAPEEPAGVTTPAQAPQAAQEAVGAGNGASGGMMIDLSTLPPAARALIEKQMSQQG